MTCEEPCERRQDAAQNKARPETFETNERARETPQHRDCKSFCLSSTFLRNHLRTDAISRQHYDVGRAARHCKRRKRELERNAPRETEKTERGKSNKKEQESGSESGQERVRLCACVGRQSVLRDRLAKTGCAKGEAEKHKRRERERKR